MRRLALAVVLCAALAGNAATAAPARALQFNATSPTEARVWQHTARAKLFSLMMGGREPARAPLDAKILRRLDDPTNGCVLQEITLQTLPDRRARVWLARPSQPKGKVGAVLALHGHGGSGEQIVRGQGLYWYGRALIEMGYVVISPDIGQHELQHTNWTLMGEQERAPGGFPVAVGRAAFEELRTAYRVFGAESNLTLTVHPGPHVFDGRDFGPKVRLTLGDNGRPLPKAPALPEPKAAAKPEAFPEMRQTWTHAVQIPAGLVKNEHQRELLRQAEKNARLANEAFFRCRRYVDGWLAHCDPETGLFPRNLKESNYWNGRDSAADNYPFMVLTAAMTDRPLMQGRLLDILRTEERLTCRLGRLPDDYSFAKRGWRREKLDLDEIIFDSAEYVKDGLLYIAEWVGPSPWTQRMIGITDDIWKYAPIETPYGKLPTRNFEVCGDMLQASARIYWFTGDRKYLDWAVRLGDYFLLGTNHPTRDMKQLRLIDHGCEVINGLSELYVAVAHGMPQKKRAYEQPIHEMFDCILDKGRNEDGMLYTWFNPKTGEHANNLCDTWGYDYDGFYTLWLIDHTESYRQAIRKALANLKGKYVGACWADKSADGFADSIEGAINLFNREPIASAADWIDSQTRMMWAIQRPDGIIEAWHGDGNFARTSLMYALWKTQGVTIEPWRADVRFGAVREGNSVRIVLIADQPWEGRVVVDRPQHKLLMHLPLDYTRINQFPEWFTIETKQRYSLELSGSGKLRKTGAQLANGLPVKLDAGHLQLIELHPD